MGWGNAFVRKLWNPSNRPTWYLKVSSEVSSPGATGFIIGGVEGADLQALGGDVLQGLSATVSRQAWTVSHGGATIRIAGAVAEVLQNLTRGSIVELWMGFDDLAPEYYERVFLGQVRSLRGSPMAGWTLQAWDIISALGTRLTPTTAETALFYEFSTSLLHTVVGGYTIADPTIEVHNGASLLRETGGLGLIKVAGDANDFVIRWSSRVGDVLTIEAVGIYGVGNDSDATAGNAVTPLGLLQGHPRDFIRKVLLSDGTGTGSFNTLPAPWGYGLPEDYVDVADISNTIVDLGVDVTVDWDVVITEEQSNGYSWIQGVLSKGGFWICQRQGSITMRACTDPFAAAPVVAPSFSIVDD